MHSRSNRLETRDEGLADLYDDMFELAGIGAWACDLRTEVLSWSPLVFDIFGLQRHTIVHRCETVGMYAEPSRFMLERLRSAAIASCGTFSLEAQIFCPNGEERWIRLKAATKARNGHAVMLYGVKEDVTHERQRWEQLRHLTEHDALTGLASRGLFHARFLDRIPGSDDLEALIGLALLNLDNVKEINRRWGIAAGDACLVAFARRLLTTYPAGTFVARLGGSEFAVLLNGNASPAVLRASNQLSSLASPVLWGGTLIPIQVSAGIVLLGQHTSFEAEVLYAQADLAREAAKAQSDRPLNIITLPFKDKARLAGDSTPSTARAHSYTFQLSLREKEVIGHIARGYTTENIAQLMGISRHTVRNFIRRTYQKMEVGSRVEAIRLAVQHGIV